MQNEAEARRFELIKKKRADLEKVTSKRMAEAAEEEEKARKAKEEEDKKEAKEKKNRSGKKGERKTEPIGSVFGPEEGQAD